MSDFTRFRDEPGAYGELAREILADEQWAEPPPAAEAAVWANLLGALPPGSLLPGAPGAASGAGGAPQTTGGSGVISGGSSAAGSSSAPGTLGASAGVKAGSAAAMAKLAALGGATKVFVVTTAMTAGGIVGWGVVRDSFDTKPKVVAVHPAQSAQGMRDAATRHAVGSTAATPKDHGSDANALEARTSHTGPRDAVGAVARAGGASGKVTRDVESGDPARTAPAVSSGLNEETALLAAARGALRRGAFSEATRLLSQHEARFASGRLTQERQALRIETLWNAGSKAAARQQLEAYRRAYPGCPHASRLSSMMEGQ